MYSDSYNHAENACRIGLALSLLAAALNILSLYFTSQHSVLSVVGILCAVTSMTAAYVSESTHQFGSYSGHVHFRLGIACILLCALSYVLWCVSILSFIY
tara:strand:+ start:441899 stop:442198 length:300 start_codon:yes stop_codon:yes gene_type:complete